MRWLSPKRWGDIEVLSEEWFKLPDDTKIVLMQTAPEFYSRMSWFSARVWAYKQTRRSK